MLQNNALTRQPSRRHLPMVLIVLGLATVFCVAVGMRRPQPERGLQILLLSLGAGVAAACAIWLMRYSWNAATRENLPVRLLKPQRITATRALIHALGFGFVATFAAYCMIYTLRVASIEPVDKTLKTLATFIFSTMVLLRCIFSIRLFCKALREGTLVITPSLLPVQERVYLDSFGFLSSLSYAVPAADIVQMNCLDKASGALSDDQRNERSEVKVADEPQTQSLTSTNL